MEDIRDELGVVHNNLTETLEDFQRETAALDADSLELHKQLLTLGAQYPDHRDLIEFIIFINDRLETRHTQHEDIVKDTIVDVVGNKKHLINIIKRLSKKLETYKPKENVLMRGLRKIKTIADLKAVIGIIAVIMVVIANLFFSSEVGEAFKYMAEKMSEK